MLWVKLRCEPSGPISGPLWGGRRYSSLFEFKKRWCSYSFIKGMRMFLFCRTGKCSCNFRKQRKGRSSSSPSWCSHGGEERTHDALKTKQEEAHPHLKMKETLLFWRKGRGHLFLKRKQKDEKDAPPLRPRHGVHLAGKADPFRFENETRRGPSGFQAEGGALFSMKGRGNLFQKGKKWRRGRFVYY